MEFNQEIKMQTITYDEQYHSYLASQAGILAKNLKENTPCPVCGSKVHPKIANINEEVLSQSQVDELRKQLDVKKSKLNEMSNQCALLIKEVEFKF